MLMAEKTENVTQLLTRLRTGDREVFDELLPLIYDELHRLAHLKLKGHKPGVTLSTTALVHEAYFKLVDHHAVDWEDRAHFFSVAVRAMRQVVVDRARRRQAQKRGGGVPKITLEEDDVAPDQRADRLIALDEALSRLEELDERQSKVVECRYFGGFKVSETADILDVSPTTVKRDWRSAKAWLAREVKRMEDV